MGDLVRCRSFEEGDDGVRIRKRQVDEKWSRSRKRIWAEAGGGDVAHGRETSARSAGEHMARFVLALHSHISQQNKETSPFLSPIKEQFIFPCSRGCVNKRERDETGRATPHDRIVN